MDYHPTIAEVVAEVERACEKFPTWPTDPLHAKAVLNEESGELEQAIVQHLYEPVKSSLEDVREEAVQTAAMAIRFLLGFQNYSFNPSEQAPHEPVKSAEWRS